MSVSQQKEKKLLAEKIDVLDIEPMKLVLS
jgi:hypothetical protein